MWGAPGSEDVTLRLTTVGAVPATARAQAKSIATASHRRGFVGFKMFSAVWPRKIPGPRIEHRKMHTSPHLPNPGADGHSTFRIRVSALARELWS